MFVSTKFDCQVKMTTARDCRGQLCRPGMVSRTLDRIPRGLAYVGQGQSSKQHTSAPYIGDGREQ
jgi:hypothetical protein